MVKSLPLIICAFGAIALGSCADAQYWHCRSASPYGISKNGTCYLYAYCPRLVTSHEVYHFIADYTHRNDIEAMRFILCPAVKYVPTGIFTSFPRLRVLDMSNSHLEELNSDDFIAAIHLEIFSASNNQLKMIKNTVFSHAVRLSQARSSAADQQSITCIFPLLQLSRINLSNNEIAEVDEYSFYGLTSLNKLLLNGNRLMKIRSLTFAGLPSLTHLDLSENSIESIAVGAFDLPELIELYLYKNKLKMLSDGLFSSLQKLQTVQLDQNELQHIGQSLYNLSRVSSIWLNDNRIGDIDLAGFALLPNLKNLTLTRSGFTFATSPSPQHRTYSTLERLDLDENNLTDASELKQLVVFPNLAELNLSYNPFKNLSLLRYHTKEVQRTNTVQNAIENTVVAVSKAYLAIIANVVTVVESNLIPETDQTLKDVLPHLKVLDLSNTAMTCFELEKIVQPLRDRLVEVIYYC